ncbi:MAG TPA: hypothetical protein PKM59_02800, partial [Thermodesulfobacteriota bacterium]|nr:hypothetical protein [Thermodesulfobacteriota bacterium]
HGRRGLCGGCRHGSRHPCLKPQGGLDLMQPKAVSGDTEILTLVPSCYSNRVRSFSLQGTLKDRSLTHFGGNFQGK